MQPCAVAVAAEDQRARPLLQHEGEIFAGHQRRHLVHIGITGVVAFVLLRPALIGLGMVLHGYTGRAAVITLACVVITYCVMVTMWVMRSAADMAMTGRR